MAKSAGGLFLASLWVWAGTTPPLPGCASPDCNDRLIAARSRRVPNHSSRTAHGAAGGDVVRGMLRKALDAGVVRTKAGRTFFYRSAHVE